MVKRIHVMVFLASDQPVRNLLYYMFYIYWSAGSIEGKLIVLLEYIVCFHSWCTIIVKLCSVVCFIIVVLCTSKYTCPIVQGVGRVAKCNA